MKFKNTLILFLVFVVLFAFIWFYERNTRSSGELIADSTLLVKVDRDSVTAITIKNPETTIELKKRDNQWFIDAPVKDRADSMIMAGLFTTLEDLHSVSTQNADKDQIKEFGLAEPNTRVILTLDKEKPVEIDFGKDSAVDGKVYAMLAGGSVVQVIPNDLKNEVSKKTEDFRDRKLTDLTLPQIAKMDVKSAAGELELERKNNHWSIIKPLAARGDDSKINDLISQASTAHIDQFLADENLANYGLSEPRGTVTFGVEGSDKPVVLQLGASPKEEKDKDKEKEKTYVKLSSREGLTLVPKKAVDALLEAKPNDIRDHNLVRFESDIVDRVNIEVPGAEKLVIARKGEAWVRKDGDKDIPINQAAAKRLIADLQGAQVDNYVADTATDLAKYGLDKPSVKVTLSSYASENTAETKAGEKPIVAILIGSAEGNDCYAKLDDEPFIVATSRTILEAIPTSPIQWQELGVYKYKPEEITAVEVSKAGQPPLAIERDKDKKWKLVKGEGTLDASAAQAMVDALASLSAGRWVGPAAPDQHLDKPTLVLDFTVTQGDKKTPGKVTVGSASPDDYWFTTAQGFAGTFAIGRPDYNALKTPLTDKAAAAEVPPPSPAGALPPEIPGLPGAPAAPGAPVVPAPVPVPAPDAAPPAVPAAPVAPVSAIPATPAAPPAEPEKTPAPAAPAPAMPAPVTPPTPAPAPDAAPAPAAPAPAAPAPPVVPIPNAPAAPAPAVPIPPAPAEPAPVAPIPPAAPAPAPAPVPASDATPAPAAPAAPAPTAPPADAAPVAPPAPAAPEAGKAPASGQ